MKNSEQPAIPVKEVWVKSDAVKSGGYYEDFSGISKREYFAAKAMQACRTRSSNYKSWNDLAKDAVEIADALLAELESTNLQNTQ